MNGCNLLLHNAVLEAILYSLEKVDMFTIDIVLDIILKSHNKLRGNVMHT